MNTNYGEIDSATLALYLDKRVGRIFKILYLKEEGCQTIDSYQKRLCREFIGASKIYFEDDFIAIAHIISGLNLSNHEDLRADIFEAINILENIKKRCV